MRIEYKFNKSSEARDCKVESVALVIETLKKITISEEELYELNNNFDDDYQRFISKETPYDASSLDKAANEYKVELDLSTEDVTIKGTAARTITSQDSYFKDIKLWKEDKTITTRTFVSPQELKDYLSKIQESIEFATDNCLDELILKEWVGEWKIKEENIYIDTLELVNPPDHIDIVDTYFKKETRVGIPKLNSNWSFLIILSIDHLFEKN